jgi:hypothetical protein
LETRLFARALKRLEDGTANLLLREQVLESEFGERPLGQQKQAAQRAVGRQQGQVGRDYQQAGRKVLENLLAGSELRVDDGQKLGHFLVCPHLAVGKHHGQVPHFQFSDPRAAPARYFSGGCWGTRRRLD